MPTPSKGYFLKDGTRVPGTTTILARWKDSGALMQWAFQQGRAGKSRLYEETEKAADIGTAVHAMVEAHTHGQPIAYPFPAIQALQDEEMRKKAWSAYSAYEAWERNFGIKVVHTEIQLVSETYRYGGTPDAIALVDNQLVLLDYKTSSGVYEDYLYQLAAYRNLWDENHPEQPLTGGSHLVRFSKEHGDFSHKFYADLTQEWEGFKLMRQLYDISQKTKQRAKG